LLLTISSCKSRLNELFVFLNCDYYVNNVLVSDGRRTFSGFLVLRLAPGLPSATVILHLRTMHTVLANFTDSQLLQTVVEQWWKSDLPHLIENTFDRKRIYANPSSYPNPNLNSNSNSNPNPNPNPNPKVQLCFRTDEMSSFFDQVYRYHGNR